MSNNNIEYILEKLTELFPNAGCELVYHNIFELVIAVSLSSQTTDKAVNKITPILFGKYPDVYALAKADISDVEYILKPLGMSKQKSKNIVALSQILIDKYNGIVPNSQEALESFPGVGRKTANVVMTEGFHIPRLPVDTHVERVSKRMGLVLETDNTLNTELKLMKLIEKDQWHKAHHLLLFMGRYKCFAKNPKCDDCFYKQHCKYDKKPLS